MRVSGKVEISENWGRYRRDLDRQVAGALIEAAHVGQAAAASKRSRYRIESVKGSSRVDVPIRVPGGWFIDIRWTDFRARFFEVGTYQKLGRVLSARSKQGGTGNRGVKPQRFERLARRVGKAALVASLRRRLR